MICETAGKFYRALAFSLKRWPTVLVKTVQNHGGCSPVSRSRKDVFVRGGCNYGERVNHFDKFLKVKHQLARPKKHNTLWNYTPVTVYNAAPKIRMTSNKATFCGVCFVLGHAVVRKSRNQMRRRYSHPFSAVSCPSLTSYAGGDFSNAVLRLKKSSEFINVAHIRSSKLQDELRSASRMRNDTSVRHEKPGPVCGFWRNHIERADVLNFAADFSVKLWQFLDAARAALSSANINGLRQVILVKRDLIALDIGAAKNRPHTRVCQPSLSSNFLVRGTPQILGDYLLVPSLITGVGFSRHIGSIA